MTREFVCSRVICFALISLFVAPALVPLHGKAQSTASSAPAASFSSAETEAANAVSSTTIREITAGLLTKEMEGRGTGQPGADRAANYIADRFAKLGLKPLGDSGGYLQTIKFKVEQVMPDSAFKANDTAFTYKKDFVLVPPLPASAVSVNADLVFAGYGVSSTELKRDDLNGLDVKGKVVVLLGGKPKNVDQTAWQKLATTQTIIAKLAAAGAAGFALVYNQVLETQPYDLITNYLTRRRVALADAPTVPLKAPPMVLVNDATAESLFKDSGPSFAELKAKAEAGEFVSQPLGKQASISVRLKREEVTSSNVVALLEGSDAKLKEEAVVYSAHYDAYGIDSDGSVYPGAADNAIGIAKLVAIAEALVKAKAKPRRSIIFLAVTGEEYGLLGTEHWLKHPTWPIEKVAADINYDGIGTDVWGPPGLVIDYGFRHSDLGDLLLDVLKAQKLMLVPDPAPQEGIFYRSDHYAFFKKGVPSLYLIGGPANNVMGLMAKASKFLVTDYHMTTDTVQPDWNWDGARSLAVTGLVAGMRIANRDAMPAWAASSPYNRPRGTNLPPPPR